MDIPAGTDEFYKNLVKMAGVPYSRKTIVQEKIIVDINKISAKDPDRVLSIVYKNFSCISKKKFHEILREYNMVCNRRAQYITKKYILGYLLYIALREQTHGNVAYSETKNGTHGGRVFFIGRIGIRKYIGCINPGTKVFIHLDYENTSDTKNKIQRWERYSDLPLPWHDFSFRLENRRLFISEFLECLTPLDNPFLVLIDVAMILREFDAEGVQIDLEDNKIGRSRISKKYFLINIAQRRDKITPEKNLKILLSKVVSLSVKDENILKEFINTLDSSENIYNQFIQKCVDMYII